MRYHTIKVVSFYFLFVNLSKHFLLFFVSLLLLYFFMRRLFLFYFILFFAVNFVYAQTLNTKFGKNRVQYHPFEWSYYKSENVTIFYSKNNQPLGEFVSRVVERNKIYVEEILEYKIGDNIDIFIYQDLSDLKQSNFGANNEAYNPGSDIKIAGNKIFLYFDGDHNHLEKQLRSGLMHVFLNYMSFGSNLQEMVKNALLLNLPNWFTSGLIDFGGEPWNADLDNELKDLLARKKIKNFQRFTEQNPKLAGHSFWNYIYESYGMAGVTQMMYHVRTSRSLDVALENVLSADLKTSFANWEKFYENRYLIDAGNKVNISDSLAVKMPVKKWDKSHKYNIKISADGKNVAYAINDRGKVKVIYYEPDRKIERAILKFGYKDVAETTDYNYPIMAISPTGTKLVVFYERKDKLYQMTYDFLKLEKKTKDISKKFTRITSANFMDGDQIVVLTAINYGRSDVYEMNIINGKTSKLTDDFFDDREVSYFTGAGGLRGLLLSSNRRSEDNIKIKMDSMLPTGNFDIWFYELTNSQKKPFIQITNTPNANERLPLQTDNNHFSYLSDENGIYNQYISQLNIERKFGSNRNFDLSTPKVAVTNYNRNIHDIAIARKTGDQYVFTDYLGKTKLIQQRVKTRNDSLTLDLTQFKQFESKHPFNFKNIKLQTAQLDNRDTIHSLSIVELQSVFENEPLEKRISDSVSDTTKGEIGKFQTRNIKKYSPTFRLDYVTTALDNGIINISELQNYNVSDGLFRPYGLGILLEASTVDLLEDYRITGGIRIPTAFNGLTYFLRYDNFKKRWDKTIQVYREGQNYLVEEFVEVSPGTFYPFILKVRQLTHAMDIIYKYPFDNLRALRISGGLRDDKRIYNTSDDKEIGLYLNDFAQQQVRARVEYVFDNTNEIGTNLRQGTRYKFYSEAQKTFIFDLEGTPVFNFKNGFMGISGLDVRHYQPVYRSLTFCARVASSVSYGNQKVLFNLGGVDNWMNEKYDNTTQPPSDVENYSYVAPAMALRGHKINVLNGNSYALLNTELRIPVFNLIFNRPLRSEFLNTFQLTPFADMATAWYGVNPFDDKPQRSTRDIGSEPLVVTVERVKNRVQSSYGVGARAFLFGYYVRVDYALPFNGSESLKPNWSVSLSMDF